MRTEPLDRIYLGLGDYEWPRRDPLVSLETARDAFLEAVRIVAPAVLPDLEQRALGACFRFMLQPHGRTWALRELRAADWWEVQADGEGGSRYAVALREALRGWEQQWGLCEAWVRERTLPTLEAWVHGAPRSEWSFLGVSAGGLHFDEDPPLIARHLQAWNPGLQHWDVWKADLLARVGDGRLERYRRWREARAETAGMVRSNHPLSEHLLWLARSQVLGESVADIADQAGRTDKAVYAALPKAAESIGLTRTKPRRKF